MKYLKESLIGDITSCEYSGETFTYPDWVRAIASGITPGDFAKKFPENTTTQHRGIDMWCGGLCEIKLSQYSGNNTNKFPIIESIVSETGLCDIDYFVTITRGKTNNEGRYHRGDAADNTTDATFRNDMVCLADLMHKYNEARRDRGNPAGTTNQKVVEII